MGDQIGDNVIVESTEVEKKEDEVKPVEHIKEKRRGKEERSKKKGDKRPAEQFLKGLNDVHSVEDKLEVMCKKYSEIVDENRKLQMTLKQYDKKMLTLQREKEQCQSERTKAALTRRRLESLCRELQKQNKAVKEESLLKIREQEELRRDLSEKFQGGLAQITALMNLNTEKNAKMYEENLEMNKKFKTVYEQFELKEQQLLKVHKEMKYDLQIADLRIARLKMQATEEKEALLKEKQKLLYKLTEYQVQIRELQATEASLRSQISMYTDKYDEFQNALTRSNEVYGEFNEEMEKMSKKIVTLEKETNLWKQRWESSHSVLLEMTNEKRVRDAEMATLTKKLALLQDLCKAFQCERTTLLAQLKKNKSESDASSKTDAEKDDKSMKEVVEAIEKGVKDECIESDIAVESKENSELSQAEKDVLDIKLETEKTERLESIIVDTNQNTDMESSLLISQKTDIDLDKVVEVPEIEKLDTIETLKEEIVTDETPVKETEISSTEILNLESTQEECSLVLNPDIMKESSTKIEERIVECPDRSKHEEKEVIESEIANTIDEPSTELSRLQSEKETNVCVSAHQDKMNGETSSNIKNLCNEVESLHTETETIIEQLYEAINSVRQETVQDGKKTLKNTINSIVNGESNNHLDNNVENENDSLHDETCEEASNERLENNVDAHETCINISTSNSDVDEETVPTQSTEIIEKSADTCIESIATSVISTEEIPSEEQSTDTDAISTDTSKAAPIKSGKRRKE